MNQDQIETFQKAVAQLSGLQEELSSIGRKKPDTPISVFKLKFVNNLLSGMNSILGDKYRPFEDFTQFDIDDVPTISDVTTIIGQYLECAETMRADNIYLGYHWRWIVDGDPENDMRTGPPKRVGSK